MFTNLKSPLHFLSSQDLDFVDSPSHSRPPYLASCNIFLVDVCFPFPQVTEHSDHSPYSDHLQSTRIYYSNSNSTIYYWWHLSLLKRGSTSRLFVIGWYIPGHGWSLQLWICVSFPWHSIPPYKAAWMTVLLEVLSPPPQDFEHLDHSPKSDHWQFSEIRISLPVFVNYTKLNKF